MFKLHLKSAAAVALLLCAASAGQANQAGKQQDPLHGIVDGLVDQNSRPITASRFASRFVLVNFIFTGCGTSCPMQTSDLARLHKKLPSGLRSRVAILSISVDPGNDKPAQLKSFAQAHGADPRLWTFATGRPDRIMKVTRNFAALRSQDGDFSLHTTEVWLFDTQHRMIQRYSGSPLAERQIRTDLNALVQIARR